jgi:hypothetical protein
MAAKTTEEKDAPKDSAEETPAAASPQSAGLKPVLISSAILAVVLGAVGFALAYFVLPGRLQAAAAAPAATSTTTPAATPATPAPAAAASTKEATQRTPAEVAASGGKGVTKFTIEEVTVNIADTRGQSLRPCRGLFRGAATGPGRTRSQPRPHGRDARPGSFHQDAR